MKDKVEEKVEFLRVSLMNIQRDRYIHRREGEGEEAEYLGRPETRAQIAIENLSSGRREARQPWQSHWENGSSCPVVSGLFSASTSLSVSVLSSPLLPVEESDSLVCARPTTAFLHF